MTVGSLNDLDVGHAFRRIDEHLAGSSSVDRGRLLALRRRLAGELIFDADVVASTLSPGFELITRAAGTMTVTSGEAMLTGIRAQGTAGGTVMWVEFEDLVVDGVIAAHGVLRTLLTAEAARARGHADIESTDLCLITFPLSIFARFDGDLMTSEVFFMDAAASEMSVLHGATMPSKDFLLDLIESGTER